MPFPITLNECRTSALYLFTHSPSFCIGTVSRFGALSRTIGVHLLMHKYHLLSMEYFVDGTWFIPK